MVLPGLREQDEFLLSTTFPPPGSVMLDLFVFFRNQPKRKGEPGQPFYRDAGVTVLRRGEGREVEVRLVLKRSPLPNLSRQRPAPQTALN